MNKRNRRGQFRIVTGSIDVEMRHRSCECGSSQGKLIQLMGRLSHECP